MSFMEEEQDKSNTFLAVIGFSVIVTILAKHVLHLDLLPSRTTGS